MNEAKCKAEIWGGYHSHTCGRKVKEDGLCGVHLRQKKERERKSQERKDENSKSQSTRIEVQEYLAEHGIDAKPFYNTGTKQYERTVVISIEELQRIVEERA